MRLAWRLLACASILVTGCSVTTIGRTGPSTPGDPDPGAQDVTITGMLHGGRQPINNAEIFLLGVNTTGYGNAARSLLVSTANTQADTSGKAWNGFFYVKTANGRFTVHTADWGANCTSGTQAILMSYSGDPTGAGSNNTAATLLATLGDCANFANLPATVQINEVTTVATAYALAGFAPTTLTDPVHFSSSGTAQAVQGVKVAAQTFGNLANLGNGTAFATLTGVGLVPQTRINSLANILASCVNLVSSSCTTLFTNAKDDSNHTPTDTATAAINIAHFPGTSRPAAFFNLSTAESPWLPQLSAAPSDWTVAIVYDNESLPGNTTTYLAPVCVAIDASGFIYITESSRNSDQVPDIVQFTPLGVVNARFTGNGLNTTSGIAIDPSGNIWTSSADGNPHSISGFTPAGAPVGQITTGVAGQIFSLAFDGSGNLWAASPNVNSDIQEFRSGALFFDSNSLGGGSRGGLTNPFAIALQPGNTGAAWISNAGFFDGTTLTSYTNTSPPAPTGGSPYSTTGFSPHGIAIDASGQIWTANYGLRNAGNTVDLTKSSISRASSNGSTITIFTGGGVSDANYGGAYDIAIDGLGNVWTANFGLDGGSVGGSISEFDNSGNALSPSPGYQFGAGSTQVQSIAIDNSGNVWVPVNGSTGGLMELVGAGAPAVTPLSVATKNSKLGTRP